MKNILLAALLLAATRADAARRAAEQPEEPKQESWSTLNMEATAVMGELKYQHGDFSGADGTFRDSLNSSQQILSPQSPVVALDLYRTAELAARRGDYDAAKHRLDILLNRFPDTEFAAKGKRLLEILPRAKGEGDRFTPVTAVVTADQPEFLLGRIQAAARARRDEEALELCRSFLAKNPGRPEGEEVRLLGAALYLRLGDAAGAERALKHLVERGRDAEVRAKAIHLLAGLEYSQNRDEEVLKLVPDMDARRAFSPWVARAQLWRAGAEQRMGRGDRAAARYRDLAEAGPSSPARAYALAETARELDRRGRADEADKTLARLSAEAAQFGMNDLQAAASLSLGHSLYKRRRFEQAAAAYADFARRNPDHPQRALALFQRGLSLKRLARNEAAVAAFTEIVERAPQSVYAADAHLQLGQLYTEQGAGEKALSEYERMGQAGEKRGRRESQLLIAQVHYNNKRYKQAVPLYSKFLDENPNEPRRAQIEELLLNSYWLGDRDNPGLLAAVEKYPNHPIVSHIRWELGAQAYKAGDYAKAAEWLARAPSEDSLFFLGEARLKIGDNAGAAEAYRALLSRFPKNENASRAKLQLAAALFASGQYEASAQAYAQAASGEGAAEALLSRALALDKAGHDEQALAAYEAWLARFPRQAQAPAVWLTVAERREKAGQLAQAAAAYAHVTDDANRPAALFAAGRLHERLKQVSQAQRSYEALRLCKPASSPSRLRGLLRLGLIYEIQDRALKAMPLYGEVLKLSPRGGEDFKAAAQRLEALSRDGSLLSGKLPIIRK